MALNKGLYFSTDLLQIVPDVDKSKWDTFWE
jgi:hypothetical protein